MSIAVGASEGSRRLLTRNRIIGDMWLLALIFLESRWYVDGWCFWELQTPE